MFAIVGLLVVIAAIISGLMEHGNLKVLMQPAELIIIGGAASGTVLVANPIYILKKIVSGVTGVLANPNFRSMCLRKGRNRRNPKRSQKRSTNSNRNISGICRELLLSMLPVIRPCFY